MLDRGVCEQPLYVAAPVEHEGREDERRQPHRHHQRARRDGFRTGGEQDLETQHGIEGNVEKQARQYGRDRRRAFRMRIRQPGVQRREADFRAIA